MTFEVLVVKRQSSGVLSSRVEVPSRCPSPVATMNNNGRMLYGRCMGKAVRVELVGDVWDWFEPCSGCSARNPNSSLRDSGPRTGFY